MTERPKEHYNLCLSMTYREVLQVFLWVPNKFLLSWSYVRLLSVKDPQARTFYETEALRSGWSVRQLDRQIGIQFYEPIAVSQNKSSQ